MTASIASNAPPTIHNMVTVSGGGDANAANNSASDTATVLAASDLAIRKSHTGNFTQGQPGTYTLTVSNTVARRPAAPLPSLTNCLPGWFPLPPAAKAGPAVSPARE